ncbi:replication factor C subunit 1 [Euwallacea fornicatus]|uniref:replication factor C subunit 1 n=1 Tax=Euwallacea fornicatus TaxID=995702 RepID=UPI00338ED9EC
MSKDIRSFFTVLSKKPGSILNNPKPKQLIDSDDEDIIESTPEKPQKKTSLKRRVQVLNSDSEEERAPSTSSTKKPKKTLKLQKDSKTKLKLINLESLQKPIEQSEVKYVAKTVEESKDNKAVKAKKKSKKGKQPEISVHDDKNFGKTLEDLDDSNDTILLDNLDFLDKTIDEAQVSSDSNENENHSLLEVQPKETKSHKSINTNKERTGSDDKTTPKKSAKRTRKLSESTPTSSKKQKLEHTDSGVDPDSEKTQRKKHSTELYISYLHRAGPKHHGEKEYPKGKPDCLKNLTFLRTGVLDSLEGEEFGNLVTGHGGRVVQSVSKKVNYVVLGDEPGPAKLEKARRYNIPELTEDQFLDMILVKSGEKPRYAVLKSESEDWGLGSFEEGSVKTDEILAVDEDNQKANNTIFNEEIVNKSLSSEKTPKEENKDKKLLIEAKKESKNISISNGHENTLKSSIYQENLSWTDKYKPTNMKGIIGQQDPNSNMYKLKKWLENWFKNVDPERRKTLPKPTLYNQHDGAYFRAALLSGPPGVGKTTTATLVSKELGFDIVEFNASDTRNKKLLHEEISHMMRSKTVAGFASGHKNINQKRVLLMDEVDGMAGNEDRGGIAELINFIKTASFPIICMCNNRDLPKMRTLVNHCFALKFGKPNIMQIRGAMMTICFKEGLTIKPEALAQLITGTGNDIRQTLNHLSMWSAAEKNLSSETVQKESKNSQKDVVFGAWDVIRKVFNKSDNKDMTLADKARLFFYDYSFGPLFVQENYLTVNPECTGPKAVQPIEMLIRRHLTADSLSESDIIERKIRSTNNWSLLESQAYFSTVLPSHYLSGTMGQVRFPGWFGKNSQRNKSLRIVGEIYTHSRTAISGDKLSVRLDYAEPLKNHLLHPLIEKKTAGIDDTLGVMKAYSLLRDDLTNLCDLMTGLATKHANPFDAVSSSVKAALTRKYNKVMVLSIAPPTAAKKKKSAKLEQEDVFEEDEEGSDGDQDEDNVDDDGLIKQVKNPKAGSSKSGAPEKQKKGGQRSKTNEKRPRK